MRIEVALAISLVLTIGASRANAWGCDGHRVVVFLAEGLLPLRTLEAVRSTLAAAPIDPALPRFCEPVPDDPIADSATWADDYRTVDASTAGWHFIDVPRGVSLTTANARTYCAEGHCAIDARGRRTSRRRSQRERSSPNGRESLTRSPNASCIHGFRCRFRSSLPRPPRWRPARRIETSSIACSPSMN